MYQYIIEFIIGIICGIILGITGIPAIGLILLLLDYLKIGDYTSNLGSILFLNLFPITIGSIMEFYKANKINYSLAFILLFSLIIGSYIGSKFVVGEKNKLSTKTIKYITSALGFTIFIAFLFSAKYENN
jgi:uncharacterized membrane protein YfcA